MTDTATTPPVTVVPANAASWDDLQAVFGTRGYPSRCQCQRSKMRGIEWDSDSIPVAERAHRLRKQTRCGQPEADTTSGLVAYLDGEPVGWCAVEPRTAYVRLGRVPWAGRAEDKTDDSVWAVTCFLTRTGFRRRGISRALARAAVASARKRDARARARVSVTPARRKPASSKSSPSWLTVRCLPPVTESMITSKVWERGSACPSGSTSSMTRTVAPGAAARRIALRMATARECRARTRRHQQRVALGRLVAGAGRKWLG